MCDWVFQDQLKLKYERTSIIFTLMPDPPRTRTGARRLSDVPQSVLEALAAGTVETVNLMEWLAADMAALARSVSHQVNGGPLRDALQRAAGQIERLSITARLNVIGRAIGGALPDPQGEDFQFLASHPSDLVRQWACYAVNDSHVTRLLRERLTLTLPFAADRSMSVREVAWMAFRPHLLASLEAAIALLEPVTRDPNSSIRRFAIEVTRPRSVWGSHCEQLKRRPQEALCLLENVRQDPVRYVQMAVGNWLNDASKSRPDWVVEVCERWLAEGSPNTAAIVRRGLRTLAPQCARTVEGSLGIGAGLLGAF
jgi:3-methyladenine DNA glycosylase AlkC